MSSKLTSMAFMTALPRLFSPVSFVPKMGLLPINVFSRFPVEASMSRISTLAVAKETSSSEDFRRLGSEEADVRNRTGEKCLNPQGGVSRFHDLGGRRFFSLDSLLLESSSHDGSIHDD